MNLAAAVLYVVEKRGGVRATAAATGISPAYISRLCSGESTNPSDEVLAKLGVVRHTYFSIDSGVVDACDSASALVSPLLRGRKRPETLAKILHAFGYAGVSNKYGVVARIDRPDWVESLVSAKPWHLAPVLTRNQAYSLADSYLRSLSKDKLEGIGGEVYKELRRLNADPVTYKKPSEVFLDYTKVKAI